MANIDSKADKTIKVTEPPKIPTLNIGGGRTSTFSLGKSFAPKGVPKSRFNQATFHTQHKGGTAGGK